MLQNDLAHVEGAPLSRTQELIWIADIPRIGSVRCPERTAILFAERAERVSYQALDQRSDAFGQMLIKMGIKAGQRIAYLGRNSDLFFPVLFGAIRAGVVLVPINWRLTAPEVAYQIRDSQSKLLICDPDLRPTAAQSIAGMQDPPVILSTESEEGSASLRETLAESASALSVPKDEAQVVLQLYTSGTTGNPKGVMISHYALSIARHCELSLAEFDFLAEGSVSLSAMPNFHVGGMSWVLMGLVRFGTVVLTADPSPANMLKLIREHRVESSFIVPTVIRAMVDELRTSGAPPPQMKGMLYGAMPMSESLLRDAMQMMGCSFLQFFGMTENTGSATYLAPADHDLERPGLLKSVGKPYPGMALEIRNPVGEVVKRGQHGEIWIHSPTRLLGYWNLPEKTREVLVDGWYASGDGGYIDAGGFLFLTDRIKDVIISGGENVYPAEVEEAVRQHPAVLDVACVGTPDERWGEAVVAFVECRPGKTVTVEELRAFVRERLAAYKCPKTMQFIESLPRTASGKVKRAELRQKL